jgi:hypothetical protein
VPMKRLLMTSIAVLLTVVIYALLSDSIAGVGP